jgi:hypothetical protein
MRPPGDLSEIAQADLWQRDDVRQYDLESQPIETRQKPATFLWL